MSRRNPLLRIAMISLTIFEASFYNQICTIVITIMQQFLTSDMSYIKIFL